MSGLSVPKTQTLKECQKRQVYIAFPTLVPFPRLLIPLHQTVDGKVDEHEYFWLGSRGMLHEGFGTLGGSCFLALGADVGVFSV